MNGIPTGVPRRRVLLDTDIGSDVDDSVALALILGSPELDLVAVTTVYGDTELRARIAKQLLTLANFDAPVPIVAGAQQTLSGRPVWWPGHEGRTYDLTSLASWRPQQDAPAFLVEQASTHPGELDLLAIGPLTNVAQALTLDPDFAHNIRQIHIMGGSFNDSRPEHNILSDTHAADIVFRSAARLVITPVCMTRRVRLSPQLVDEIEAAGTMGAALAAEIRQWMEIQSGEHSIPHDATTALGLIRPDLFQHERCVVDVVVAEGDGQQEGTTIKHRDDGGTADVVVDLDEAGVQRQIVDRVCAAHSLPGSSR